MKYVITRTSSGLLEYPDCPNAQKELISHYGELVEAYTLEIDSLEDLHALSVIVGSPVIVFPKPYYGFDLPALEIYDYYRE